MTELNDSGLLQAYAAARDAQAFAEIVRRHAGMVYAVARRITGNGHDAEDVAQTCFLELSRKAGSIRTSPAGWLHQAATFRASDLVRNSATRSRHERQALPASAGPGEANWEQIESAVDEALQRLPEELREPLVLHFLQGRSQVAVARQLGLDQSTVSRRLVRGIGELRELLAAGGLLTSVDFLSSHLAAHGSGEAPASLTASLGKLALSGAAVGHSGAIASLVAASYLKWSLAVAVIIALAAGIVVTHNTSRVSAGRFNVRSFIASDWDTLQTIADKAISDDLAGNKQWAQARRALDEKTTPRRHYVVESSADGKVVGYGAIEVGPDPSRARLFLVAPADVLAVKADELLSKLSGDAASLNVTMLWAREYARDIPLVSALTSRGFDITQRFTPAGMKEMVMLEKPLPDINGIFAAAKSGDAKEAQRLLSADAKLVAARDREDGKTPLHVAKDAATAAVLLSFGADIEARDDSHGSTPLHWALERDVFPDESEKQPQQSDLVPFLLEQGAKTDIRFFAAAGDLERVKAMVQTNPEIVNLHFQPKDGGLLGATPLSAATDYGVLELVRYLLDQGAEVNFKSGATALHSAAWSDRPQIAELLIERGAKMEVLDDTHHSTPLNWAVTAGHPKVVDVLLRHGAIVQQKYVEDAEKGEKGAFKPWSHGKPDGFRQAAELLRAAQFFKAATDGNRAVISRLLARDEIRRRINSLSATPPVGFTALHLAAHYGHTEVMRLLIDAGADVNEKSDSSIAPKGNRPLHAAIAGHRLEAVRLLLQRGADPNAPDDEGHTPLYGNESVLPEIVGLLREHGGHP